jgi:hypothetical protein
MKFTQVPLGQRFRYQDRIFRKVAPLMASLDGEDKQQLIPRSAIVEPLDVPPDMAETETPENIPVAQLDRAMTGLARDINEIISESGLNAEEVNTVMRQLQTAFHKTRRNLNLP